MATTWKKQWNSWIAPTRYPGVYRRRDGGHLVRARVTLPMGDRPEIRETYLDTQTDPEAFARLSEMKRQLLATFHREQGSSHPQGSSIADGGSTLISTAGTMPPSPDAISSTAITPTAPVTVRQLEEVLERRSKIVTGKSFSEFARDVAERRADNGNNATPASRDKFDDMINHLVDGTTVHDAAQEVVVHCEGLGAYPLEELLAPDIEAWKARVSQTLIKTHYYAPTTANGWITTLKSIMTEATHLYRLPRNEASFLKPFSTLAHVTYTRARPNALKPVQAYHFMRLLRSVFPQHYGMTFLGLYTGLRLCNVRPLRRRGPEADIDWQTGLLRVARSQTRKQVTDVELRPITKQGTQYSVQLPRAVLDVLEWHTGTQLTNAKMMRSDLLFPSMHGSFRAPGVLDKPFDEISRRLKLGFKLTPRGLRRTFNDLARRAEVDRSVTRSISGHLTEEMQELYESVGEDETCRAVTKVVALVERSRAPGKSGPEGRSPVPPGDVLLKTLVEQLSQLLVGLREPGNRRRPHEVRDLFEDDPGDGASDEAVAAE